MLLSAFQWSYALLLVPSGAFADRFGPRRWIAVGLAIWSLAQVAAGFVTSYGQFIVARVFLGVGESPCMPSANRATTDWFHVRERGLAAGGWSSASALGPAIAAPLLTVLMLWLGWRGMFVAMGAAGLVMVVVWFAVYRAPEQTRVDPEERAALSRDDPEDSERVTLREWGRLFAKLPTWGMILGFFGCVYLGWLYLTWLPGYLEIARHLDIAATGAVASIPFFAGFLGYLCGGVFTHRLGRAGLSPITSSKYPIVIGLVGMAVFTVPAAFTGSTALAVACISLAEFCNGFPGSMCWALAASVAPRSYVGSLGGIQDFGGYVGGALAPTVTGVIVGTTGSFVPALLLGAAIAVLSAISYALLVRRPISGADLAG